MSGSSFWSKYLKHTSPFEYLFKAKPLHLKNWNTFIKAHTVKILFWKNKKLRTPRYNNKFDESFWKTSASFKKNLSIASVRIIWLKNCSSFCETIGDCRRSEALKSMGTRSTVIIKDFSFEVRLRRRQALSLAVTVRVNGWFHQQDDEDDAEIAGR